MQHAQLHPLPNPKVAIAKGGAEHMHKKIRPGLSNGNSASQQEAKYVLEDVFWVPISNCISRRSTPPAIAELRPEKLETDEASNPGDSELAFTRNLR
jgi:hypothetical protein